MKNTLLPSNWSGRTRRNAAINKISTAAELAAFRDIVNGNNGGTGEYTACAKLMNDIIIYDDLLDGDGNLKKDNRDLVSWEPIGTPEYSGTFDGQGHTIFGLYCERDGDEEEAVAGLFRTINNDGEVRNLNVAESFVSAGGSSGKAGGICQYNHGAITGCTFSGSVRGSGVGSSTAGGVCGQNHGAITGCTFSGSVSVSSSASSTVGGVCGWNVGAVSNCLNTGAVAATGGASYNYVGGICGQNGDRSESGAVSRTVENCLNTGNVTMDGNGTNIGGVCGYNSATVTNCCYYLADDVLLTIGIDAVGGGEGTVKDTAGTSKEQLASGEVAFLLNGFTSGKNVPWRQNLDNGETADPFPVLEALDPGHGIVYPIKKEGGEEIVRYSNSADGTWDISDCTVTLSTDAFTYNGKEQTPEVKSVQWGKAKKDLDVGTDYTVEIPESKDAGAYTVTVTGKGNYVGSVTVPYTIEKATLIATYVGETVTVGETPALVVSVTGFVNGETAGTAAGYTPPTVSATGAEIGSYQLTPSGGSARNYTFQYVSGTLTIQAAGDTPGGSSGGGGSPPTYRPDVEQPEGGEVSVSPSRPEQGDDVTVTPEPEEGYEVDEVTVTDRNGNEVEVTDNGDGTFSFTQPFGKVTIEVTFREVAPAPLPFADVPAGAWYEDAVRYVWENGLMTGAGADVFSPDAITTRGQIVTILWRRSGSPVVNYLMDYSDVDPAAWYGEAVRWATSEGIVGGYGGGLFGPDDAITREQMATMLGRYAQHAGYDTTQGGVAIREYADYEQISDFALEALNWAVSAGIINGTSGATLSPGGSATRAQAAVMLMRFCEWDK